MRGGNQECFFKRSFSRTALTVGCFHAEGKHVSRLHKPHGKREDNSCSRATADAVAREPASPVAGTLSAVFKGGFMTSLNPHTPSSPPKTSSRISLVHDELLDAASTGARGSQLYGESSATASDTRVIIFSPEGVPLFPALLHEGRALLLR